MSLERYQFGQGAEYDAFLSAQALMRYDLLRPICAGKRVLDVACGEAYGSYLLASWGAAEVVGVDISAAAIDLSRKLFAHPHVRYYVGDVLKLEKILGESKPFDIIVSFETIEHVSNINQFLKAICKYRAQDGVVAISCPNDAAGLSVGEINEFHMQQFTLEEFQKATTPILGGADQWLIGTPIVGGMHYASNDPAIELPDGDPKAIISGKQGPRSTTIPPQLTLRPSAADCIHYVGVWGATLEANVVVAPTSLVNGIIHPWKKAAELDAHRRLIDENLTAIEEKDNCIQRLQGEKEALEAAFQQVPDELLKAGEAIGTLREENMRLSLEQHKRRQTAVTIQELRRRVLFHAEERLRSSRGDKEKYDTLERRLFHTEERLRSSRGDKEKYDTLERRFLELQEGYRGLEDQLRAQEGPVTNWRQFSSSRSYRVVRIYYRLFDLPVIGNALRTLRRPLSFLRRARRHSQC
jgi:SAM-dependent methyltransferase